MNLTAWTGTGLTRGWPFTEQLAAAGLVPSDITPSRWYFKAERLMVHVCATSKCEACRDVRQFGYTPMRITKTDIDSGVALDAVGRALWAATRPREG